MSIASELTRIQTAKADIKTAVANKGVTIPNNALISSYSQYINNIQTGINFPFYTCNFYYLCAGNPSLIDDLNNANIYGYYYFNITHFPKFDINMEDCFAECEFDAEDPIGLVNKVIDAGYNNYSNANFSATFEEAIFTRATNNQSSTIIFKNGDGSNPYKTIDLTYMFIFSDISNFKDIELDFTNISNIHQLEMRDIFSGVITGNNGFKITNLPVNLFQQSQELAPSYNSINIKKFTSNGSSLNTNLNISGLNMTRNVFMEFINSLGTTSRSDIEIKVNSDVYNLLTSDDLAAATAKNYTITTY